MAIKQTLIVDDSKSARVVLKRMLEELGLEVDAVESADDAIDYLKKHRPDVIFMDHMMPGMDGFEAVKLIKNNTRTAVIPIMMYTSRGGDVYLSQARALGAVGIIPKTISPVGLKESLFKLGWIDERRNREERRDSDDRRGARPEVEEPVTAKTDKQLIEENILDNEHDTSLNDLSRLMDDQTIELHKSMWLGVESVSHEIFNRLNARLEEQFEKLQPEKLQSVPGKNINSWLIYVVSALLILSILFNVVILSDINRLENKLAATLVVTNEKQTVSSDKNIDTQTVAATEAEENLAVNRQVRMAFIKWTQNKTIEYPYDELALNDNRLPGIEALFKRAMETGYSGSIMLQTHVGRFCLSRDGNGNYKLADDSLPVPQCEYIGNHIQPIDLPSTHQSLSFANHLSDLSLLNEKGIVIEVTNVARTTEIPKYPNYTPQITAKEWNLAAQSNNRITVKLKPASVGLLPESQQIYIE